MTPLAFIGLLLLGVILADAVVWRLRLRRLLNARAHWSICQFARAFPKHQRDTDVLRAVYNYFGAEVVGDPEGLPVQPDDIPTTTYEMHVDDLVYAAPELAALAGRTLERAESNPYYGSVNTVRDLVLFLLAQPKVSAG